MSLRWQSTRGSNLWPLNLRMELKETGIETLSTSLGIVREAPSIGDGGGSLALGPRLL
jgi:hypothetical protein